jgi:hypothetical protein
MNPASLTARNLTTALNLRLYNYFAKKVVGSEPLPKKAKKHFTTTKRGKRATTPDLNITPEHSPGGTRPTIDAHGRDVLSRFFFYTRDMENMLRFGVEAPLSAEMIYVDPSKLERCINQSLASRIDSGRIKNGDWDLETKLVEDEPKVRGVKQHILDGLPWSQTECYKVAKRYLLKGSPHN